MSKPISTTELHYRKNPFRFVVVHFGPNRSQRRRDAVRNKRTGKLMTPESINVPYLSRPWGLMPAGLGLEGVQTNA